MIEKKNFYINGKWVSPSKPNDFEVIDPSTEEPFAIISLGSTKDADDAINAAKIAFEKMARELILTFHRIQSLFEETNGTGTVGTPLDYTAKVELDDVTTSDLAGKATRTAMEPMDVEEDNTPPPKQGTSDDWAPPFGGRRRKKKTRRKKRKRRKRRKTRRKK